MKGIYKFSLFTEKNQMIHLFHTLLMFVITTYIGVLKFHDHAQYHILPVKVCSGEFDEWFCSRAVLNSLV